MWLDCSSFDFNLFGDNWSFAFFGALTSVGALFMLLNKQKGEKEMALIQCPECGGNVSSNAKSCIHCGNPLTTPDYSLKVLLTDTSGMVAGHTVQTVAKIKYTFTDDKTGKVLGEGYNHEVVTLNIDKPTTIRCHLGRGFKDAILDYKPRENAKYKIICINGLFNARIEFQQVDNFN